MKETVLKTVVGSTPTVGSNPTPSAKPPWLTDKFDSEGRLSDEKTRIFIGKYLEAYAVWVDRFGPATR